MSNQQENTHRNAKRVHIGQSGVQPDKGWPIKQQKTHSNAKGMLTGQSGVQNRVQPANGSPINKKTRTEMLKECLLGNQEYNQIKGGQ